MAQTVMKVQVIAINHDDTDLEALADRKQKLINEALMQLHIPSLGSTVLQVLESPTHASYELSEENSYRTHVYHEQGTLVTILYLETTSS